MNVSPLSSARTSRPDPTAEVTAGSTTPPPTASRARANSPMQQPAAAQRLPHINQPQTQISVQVLQGWAKPTADANDVSSGAQAQRQAIVNELLKQQQSGTVSVPALTQSVDEVLRQLSGDILRSIKAGEGRTPTYIAAKDGHTDCLSLLIKAGADVNQATDKGTTPAFISAQQGHADCLSLLIKAGADVNQAREEGATPASVAAQKGHTDCLILLHRSGANLSLATPFGTPLAIAERKGHSETADTIRLLLKSSTTLAVALHQSESVTPALLTRAIPETKTLHDLAIALQLVSNGLGLGDIELNDETRHLINEFFWAVINNVSSG
jgi:hypothetical protein